MKPFAVGRRSAWQATRNAVANCFIAFALPCLQQTFRPKVRQFRISVSFSLLDGSDEPGTLRYPIVLVRPMSADAG